MEFDPDCIAFCLYNHHLPCPIAHTHLFESQSVSNHRKSHFAHISFIWKKRQEQNQFRYTFIYISPNKTKLFVIEIKRMNNSVSVCERGRKSCTGKKFSLLRFRAIWQEPCWISAVLIECQPNILNHTTTINPTESERERKREKNDKWQIFGDDSRS